MGFNIYIVEDMAISRMALTTMLESHGHTVAGSAARADKAWLELRESTVDIVLLDINLAGDRDGIWLAKKIRANNDLAIIFITAYGDKETLENLKIIKPNGYIMKPYNSPTVLAALDIATRSFTESKIAGQQQKEDFIFIKEKNKKIKVIKDDIHYIKSDGNYIEIVLAKKRHVIRDKLSTFLEMLNAGQYLQTHRRYVVNTHKIQAFHTKSLFVNNTEIPVSSTYKNLISRALEKLRS